MSYSNSQGIVNIQLVLECNIHDFHIYHTQGRVFYICIILSGEVVPVWVEVMVGADDEDGSGQKSMGVDGVRVAVGICGAGLDLRH